MDIAGGVLRDMGIQALSKHFPLLHSALLVTDKRSYSIRGRAQPRSLVRIFPSERVFCPVHLHLLPNSIRSE
jgi:hypothetical protein